ncbi:VanZ family protein [Lentibacillus salicampi]|uniref:VanZ family protein n=1 Tax=Lentibacillus salicampi TaxID=175306 RepID=A0A4Y9A990_9BACI|nr:VanZ family protein [Lentibacillus salicampi]TFJ92373.1 VanZ family protein [Lentibacillus salicampi]
MKRTKLMNSIMVHALFALYVYALFITILFKFDSIDITFLMSRLQRNLGDPNYILGQLQSGNFILFKTISNYFLTPSIHHIINLVGNIVIFIPFGFFISLLSKAKEISFIGVSAQSLCLSLCLECLQVVFSIGSFDVDDLVLNTFGGLLGYGVFKLIYFPLKATFTIKKVPNYMGLLKRNYKK